MDSPKSPDYSPPPLPNLIKPRVEPIAPKTVPKLNALPRAKSKYSKTKLNKITE